jgi:hypothetical protein
MLPTALAANSRTEEHHMPTTPTELLHSTPERYRASSPLLLGGRDTIGYDEASYNYEPPHNESSYCIKTVHDFKVAAGICIHPSTFVGKLVRLPIC